ncbi:MAG TPA: cobalamin biosynthesis protein [Syntrophales bacterium]|nr:cobalamin biosynthesis protein [Syntrophales bacterium]
MKTAIVSLSIEGARIAKGLQKGLGGDIFLHEKVPPAFRAQRFKSIVKLTGQIFSRYDGLVYIVPCGVAVRAIAKHISSKAKDPGVVVVDAGGRYTVSILGGHEGGANELAIVVANIIGCEPVITTTTETLKSVIVGIGCRRGVKAETIIAAVDKALHKARVERADVRLLASADVKKNEKGLLEAARLLGIPLRFIGSEEIRASKKKFARSAFVEEMVKLPAVAEPAALLAGRRTRLILPKMTSGPVTVAVAWEGFSLSE